MPLLLKYRQPILLSLAALVIAAGSYALGRYGTPEKVVIQERVQVVEVEKEKIVEVEVEKKVYVEAEKRSVHREETETVHPDGTIERKKVEDINVDRVVEDTEVKIVEVEKERLVEVEVEKQVFVTKTVPLPDWKVSALVGGDVSSLPELPNRRLDPMRDLAVGAQVERRIWGPVFVGMWGVSSGQVGLSVSMEF